jgi:hypothetical protein
VINIGAAAASLALRFRAKNIGAAAASLALRFRAKNICRPKRLIGRPQEALLCAKAEATATNILSVRKRSDSNKYFICAKAKRQQQMFYLCESEATATKRPVGTKINHTI